MQLEIIDHVFYFFGVPDLVHVEVSCDDDWLGAGNVECADEGIDTLLLSQSSVGSLHRVPRLHVSAKHVEHLFDSIFRLQYAGLDDTLGCPTVVSVTFVVDEGCGHDNGVFGNDQGASVDQRLMGGSHHSFYDIGVLDPPLFVELS